MKFITASKNLNRYVDNVFSVVRAAKADNDVNKINATAGCLCDETGKLLTYNTVFDNEKNITNIQKASYASSPAGNDDYIKAITNYILEDKVTNNHGGVATAGGTGAIYAAMKMCLQENDNIIYPEIAWGNYKIMATEFNLKPLTYNVYDLDDLFAKIDSCERKAFVLINSPCENPLGHSYTYGEWQKIMDKLNNSDKEIVLLVDNAYMDYGYNEPKEFLSLFNNISDNVLVLLACSCSKSFSYYGVRLGALLAINNDAEFIDTFVNLASRLARSTWSNINNAAMLNVTQVLTEHFDEYVKERDESIKMLKNRSDLFIAQAKECELETYPYSDGFFVTLKFEDLNRRDEVHQRLIDNHIYTIKVNKGIRIGLCSVPLDKVDGLAKRIRDLL